MTAGDEAEVVRSTVWSAGAGCHGGCGVLLHVKDGKLIKVEGDPNHPWNQGRTCPRNLALTQYMYHPDRIIHPMKRVGERGKGKFQRITWDEALKTVEEKFRDIRRRYGGPSIVFAQGTGRDIGGWMTMLAYSVGSPNWVNLGLSGHSCYTPRLAGTFVTLGEFVVMDASQWFEKRYDDPRYTVPECVVVWGTDPSYVCPDGFYGPWVIDCMKRGAKAIVIDPRCTWLATRANLWLQIRPGTDGALAMAMLNVIISEELHDRRFVEEWTNAHHLIRLDNKQPLSEKDMEASPAGPAFYVWDQASGSPQKYDPATVSYESPEVQPALEGTYEVTLADGSTVACKTAWQALNERVAEMTLEKAEKITWIPKDKIVEAARLYAKSKPAAIHWGLGIDMAGASTPAAQAITQLWCIAGNLEVPGGNVVAKYAFGASQYPIQPTVSKAYDKTLPPEVKEQRIGAKEFPLVKNFRQWGQPDVLFEQMKTGKPYPIKGMWIQTNNVIACMGADPKGHYERMKNLEFVVVVDLFMTPTAVAFADIVLPAASYAEKDGFRSWWAPLSIIKKAVQPVGESRSDMEINFELAKRFNPDGVPYKDSTEMLDEFLKPAGVTFKQLSVKHWVMPPEGHPSMPYRRHEMGLLRPDGQPGFNTPTGKVELYSTRLASWGMNALPYYDEPKPDSPLTTPEIYKEYPLILLTGRRSPAYFHSEHRQIPWCRELDPEPVVEIHPETARSLGVGDGDWVWIENRFGKCRRKAKTTPIVHPKMVMAPHGWWLPELPGPEPSLYGVWELNVNQLIPMGYQGESGYGGAPYRCMLCRVRKAEGGVY